MSVLTAMKSSFSGVPDAPPDPILSLNAMFLEDKSPKKVNLGVGAYRTDESKSYILPVVHEVEKRLVRRKIHDAFFLVKHKLLVDAHNQ